MNSIKKIGIAVLIIIIVISFTGMFLPSTIKLERSIEIKAPVNLVFDQVNNLKNWESWSPWVKNDPGLKVLYNDIPVGKGASFSWSGSTSGKGSLLIIDSIKDSLVIFALEFKEESPAHSMFKFENKAGDVKVTWSFESEIGNNPFTKVIWIIGKKAIANSFEKGLMSLKEQVELKK